MTATVAASTDRLIDLAPELLASYRSFFDAVFDGGTLDPRTRAAAALAAAITINRAETVRSFLAAAKQVGLSNEDIGQIAAIVDVIRLESHQKVSVGGGGGASSAAPHVHAPKASKSCC